MIPPPFLELLEDRRLLSGLSASLPVVPLPENLSAEFTSLLALARSDGYATDASAMRIELAGSEWSALFDREELPLFDYAVDYHREGERETLSSLVSGLENDTVANPIVPGSTAMRSGAGGETPPAALNDRSRTVAETSGLSSALPSGAIAVTLSSAGNLASSDATADLAAAGPFADAVFLDGWQDGLPAPQVDLVPVANKDLTIIAAYLVGPPAPAPSPAPAPEIAPASYTEAAPTDFIVGLEPARPELSAVPPVAREPAPSAPERLPPAPPVQVQAAVEPRQCDQPRDNKNSPSEARQSADADGVRSSGTESADAPDESGEGE